MTAPGVELSRLTRSSQAAVGWAAVRADSLRGDRQASKMAKQSAPARPAVTIPDLLAGIILAHPDDSEPAELFRHARLPEDRLKDLVDPLEFADPGGALEPPLELTDLPALDPEATHAVTRALELARTVNPETDHLVRLRDLFGGLLLGSSQGPALLSEALDDSPLDLEAVIAAYADYLALDSGSSRLGVFLRERLPLAATTEPPAPRHRLRVAVVDADRPGTHDWVGIGAEVDALAYLMAAPTLQPPLAVGLFGDWGSGKSFFMEALRRRIDTLTEAARASDRPQRELAIYRHVGQIEFNAWHYVEGNLWASLVEHIFQTLSGGEGADDELAREERMRRWTTELESQQVARAEVDRRLRLLRDEQGERTRELERSRQERKAKLQALEEARARDVLTAVALEPELQETIEALLADVGLTAAQASALETREALDDARGVLQRGNALLTPLRQKGWAGSGWALILVAVALSGPAVAWGLTLIPDVAVDTVTRTLTGIAAFLSSIALVLRKGSGWLSGSLHRVESAQARLEAIRAERAQELAREEAGLKHQLDILDDEVGRLADRKAEIDARIATIEAELKSLTPTRLLSEFIDERVGSEDYRKHLGVPALVRRDFRRLSSLIQGQNEAILAGKEAARDAAPVVNRVILYIDDLDRCPPERVVEVLQAVHLLLAFELFVVVVAVDSRWLSRSLLTHYDSLLGAHAGMGGASADQATPDNYLEKIFQIPFHVRPLTEEAQRRILLGLLDPVADSSDTTPVSTGERGPSSDGGQKRARIAEAPAGSGAPPDSGSETDPAGAGDRSPLPDAGGGTARVDLEQGDGPHHAANLPQALDIARDRMRIRRGELAFMEELRPLLGRTPRSMKRFVNVYRLMTAIADARGDGFYVEPEEPEEGQVGPAGGGEPPPYQLAMFLLAVVTGLPGLAPAILQGIGSGVSAVERGQRTHDQTTLGWVMQRYAAGGLVLRPEGPSPEYLRLKAWLDTHDGGRWADVPVGQVAPWVDLVSRFSFRSEVGTEA